MKFGWRGALGILLSAAFLVYAFKGIEWSVVAENVRQADAGLLALSAVVATLIFPLRARRWRPILDPVRPGIPFAQLWSATAIGMMINNVVPARAGEPARAYALSRSVSGLPFAASLASLAVDRLFDTVVVLGLMLLAMLDPAFPQGVMLGGRPVSHYALFFLVLVLGLLAVMYALILAPQRFVAVYERIAGRIAPRLVARGREVLLAIAGGLSVIRSPSRAAIVLAWTLLHWLTNALAFWIAFEAVGIDVPFSAALFLQGIISIGVAIPQAPGFFGVFETFGKIGLGVYGIPADQAVTWAIGFHVLSYIPITLIGAWYFIRAGLRMGEITEQQRAAAGPAASAPPAA